MSSPSTPELTDDALIGIFSFCSPRTLAACTQVSYKFLSLASPILYHEVTIETSKKVQQMFFRVCTPVSF